MEKKRIYGIAALVLSLAVLSAGLTSCQYLIDSLSEAASETGNDLPTVDPGIDPGIEELPTLLPETRTDPPAQPPTEPPTELPTEPPAGPATEAPTEPWTEAPTEAPTEPEVPTECSHTFTAWKQDTAPTCTSEGRASRVCTLCGISETEVLPAAEHTPGQAVTTESRATRLLPGQTVTAVSCTVCGRELSRTVKENEAAETQYERLYRRIRSGLEAGETTIDVSDEKLIYDVEHCTFLSDVIADVSRSTGWFMLLERTFSLKGSGYIGQVVFTPAESPEIRARKLAEAGAMIDEIAALAPSGASPLETALFFHDYLVEHFEYDTSYENYEMYAMLTTGRGVCQAYTHLYIELLTRCGIPASYCECGEINHIWTVIALDGRTYHIDVTWDDPVGNMPGKVPHKYFLLTDEEMRLSHGTKWICTETCSDTRFSDWWLRDVETAVRMTDGGVYAVADNRLIRAESLLADSTESLTDLGMWKIGSGGRYWRGCYAGLCLCGDSLYVNACDRVLRCDPMTAAVTETGISTKNDWFYGMTSDGHTLTLHISTGEDPVTITETRTVVP